MAAISWESWEDFENEDIDVPGINIQTDSEDWENEDIEDWENEDFEVPVLNVQTQEQLKRLEEQKLVEEADNALTRELFRDNNKKDDLAYTELKHSATNKNIPQKTQLPSIKNKMDKQKEHEQRQKELSKKLKEEKAKKLKEKEIFGEAEYDDTYADYEDKFY
jgi:hypothetical protein